MGFCCAGEIAACVVSSDFLSGVCKHDAEFHIITFYFSKGLTSRQHAAQTIDQSALTSEKADWQTVKQNGGLFDLKKSSALSFDFVT